MATGSRPITRVRLRNYRNIARCDVDLRPLTVVVGPNGAGKGNLLDALRFVADGLRASLEHAVRERGGIGEVVRRSHGHPRDVALRLDLQLPSGRFGHYALRLAPREGAGHEVREEECVLHGPAALERVHFHVRSGVVVDASAEVMPPAAADRLYLVNASGLAEFREPYDVLSRLALHRLDPRAMRDPQPPDPGDLLAPDGRNLAGVVERMAAEAPEDLARVEHHLARIVPGVEGVEARPTGARQAVGFRQRVTGSADPWRFAASGMSEGTVRALGALVALFQPQAGEEREGATLVGVEEPELGLHPSAVRAMVGAIREAAGRRQVIVTSHSPDLLDAAGPHREIVLAVEADGGAARIAPLADGGGGAGSLGELLRDGRLRPDRAAAPAPDAQMPLFEAGPAPEA